MKCLLKVPRTIISFDEEH